MKKKVLGLVLIGVLSLGFTGCADYATTNSVKNATIEGDKAIGTSVAEAVTRIEKNSYGREITITEQSQMNFNKNQPADKLEWTLERDQLNERNKRWNDKNKISYIYEISDSGIIIAEYVIKGKVSSVNSKLTSTNQLVYLNDSYEDNVAGVVESPSMDGSYGSNGDAIFFFLTDGTYMEWNGKYQLSDRPVKLSQKPLMTYDANKIYDDNK